VPPLRGDGPPGRCSSREPRGRMPGRPARVGGRRVLGGVAMHGVSWRREVGVMACLLAHMGCCPGSSPGLLELLPAAVKQRRRSLGQASYGSRFPLRGISGSGCVLCKQVEAGGKSLIAQTTSGDANRLPALVNTASPTAQSATRGARTAGAICAESRFLSLGEGERRAASLAVCWEDALVARLNPDRTPAPLPLGTHMIGSAKPIPDRHRRSYLRADGWGDCGRGALQGRATANRRRGTADPGWVTA
jgi:hypothetical protein